MQRTKILIVDDEEAILFAMRKYFEGLGYYVDCAYELEEAEALLANFEYGLVIADLRLTGIGGVEGLDIVAHVHQRCPGTRVLLLTAYGSPEIEREALRRGAHALLHKPKPLPELAEIAVTLLEQR